MLACPVCRVNSDCGDGSDYKEYSKINHGSPSMQLGVPQPLSSSLLLVLATIFVQKEQARCQQPQGLKAFPQHSAPLISIYRSFRLRPCSNHTHFHSVRPLVRRGLCSLAARSVIPPLLCPPSLCGLFFPAGKDNIRSSCVIVNGHRMFLLKLTQKNTLVKNKGIFSF